MKKLLIIYPHWPPSNLAGVHRPRLLSNFLEEFGWKPILLTVDSRYYEEKPDYDFIKTVNPLTEVHYVRAFPLFKKFRFFGDISLRGFFQLYKGAFKLIKGHQIDYIYIPIPAYYTAILGRLMYFRFKIPYGIDYIDPWWGGFPGSEKKFSKAWFSNMFASVLEPFSLKKASLITGVNKSYYQYVFDKKWVPENIANVGMPYGFDPSDHEIKLSIMEYPWGNIPNCKPLIYAGAFLPKSHLFIKILFKQIAQKISTGKWDDHVHLFFIGTGMNNEKSIAQYSIDYGIDFYVHEIGERFPFLQVLDFLSASFGVMIIGSTEKHYTASKTFQSLLSKKPVFAILHHESSACEVLKECDADSYLVEFNENGLEEELCNNIILKFNDFIAENRYWEPKLLGIEKYSARESAKILANALDIVIQKND
ncbi:MAG: hypothetical protein NTY07_16265 [Bacteroidia bacterium]|nr:hypothetical protein [Bacteroidia bacterium]